MTAPTISDESDFVFEDDTITFSYTHFSSFADADGDDPAAFLIVTLPTAGTLKLGGVDVVAGQEIPGGSLGSLTFHPVANASASPYATFTFQVKDTGGEYSTTQTYTLDVVSVNDEPAGADKTVTTPEDTAFVFTAADFGFSDPIDGNSFTKITITTLPASGTLLVNGSAATEGQSVLLGWIDVGGFKYVPPADANGTAYASFSFSVGDNGGVAGGGVDSDSTPNTITIDVTSVNDAPAGADNTVATLEDAGYTFETADFGFSDAVEGHGLLAVKITSIPGGGTLTNNGTAVTAGQSVAAADIAGGLLVYTPAPNGAGAGHASFTFQVQDNGGTANGGVDLAPANTITIDVTPVNDAPSGSDATVTTLEDTAHIFTAANFGFTDTPDGNALAVVKIVSIPGGGTLTNNGTAVTAGQSIAVADIAGGLLVYTPAADGAGAAHASFTFQVQDDGGTLNGGADLDASANTIIIDVTPVNDAPTGSVLVTGTAAVGQLVSADASGLADVDGLGGFSYQWLRGGEIIDGATSQTYTIAAEDIIGGLSVRVSYTDGFLADESIESAPVYPSTAQSGGGGGDTLTGGAGDDSLDGGRGADTMIGGAGDDSYAVDSKRDVVVEVGGEGEDNVSTSTRYKLAPEVEILTLTGTRNLRAMGNDLDNLIVGNDGDNQLTGGLGADTLTGGLGRDRFDWTSVAQSPATAGQWDVVTDFNLAAGEQLVLRAIDANVARSGNQSFQFIGTAAFSGIDASGQLRFDSGTNMVYASIDSDADAEFAIELTGVTSLTAAAFQL